MDSPLPNQGMVPLFTPVSYRTPKSPARERMSGGTRSTEHIGGGIHIPSHMDALIHVQHDLETYGGCDTSDIRTDFGWTRYGAETIPPICACGVLVDAAGHLGVERIEDGYEVSIAEMRAVLRIEASRSAPATGRSYGPERSPNTDVTKEAV